MPLGSPSSFCCVRRIYVRSCYFSITAVPPVPGLSLGSVTVLLFPCPARRCCPELARQVLVCILLRGSDLRGPPSAELTLCVTGLCALVSAPGCSLHRGVVWSGSGFPCPPSVCGLYVHLFPLTASLCHGHYLFFFQLCREGCVRCPRLYACPLSAPQSGSLHRLCFHFLIFKKCVLLSSGCMFHLIIIFGVSHYHCLSLFNVGIQTCFHVLTTNSLFLSKTNIQNICFDKKEETF